MRTRWSGFAAATVLGLLVLPNADAQRRNVNQAENALVGVRLYDPGTRLLSLFGNPDQILPITVGGGAVGPQGGGGAGAPGGFGPGGFPGGGPGMGGPPRGGGSPTGGAAPTGAEWMNDWTFGNEVLRQQGPPAGFNPPGGPPPGIFGPPGGQGRPGGGMGPQMGPPSGMGMPGGMAPGGAGAAPRGGGPGVPSMGGPAGASGVTQFTRWVFNRNGSKYGFVLDSRNRVIQIEAMGLSNSRVRTRRGVTFGSTFATIIRTYGAPDHYEINGDIIVMRYLAKSNVVFRLSRLGAKKPHQVTAVVVAAGT